MNTVLILEDEIEYETKRWDLREPKDVLELCIILDNLRRYTADRFSGLVGKELFSLRKRLEEGKMKSWKWDGRVEIEDESDEDTSVSSEEEGSDDENRMDVDGEEHHKEKKRKHRDEANGEKKIKVCFG